MTFARRRKQAGSGLLAALLLISAWGSLWQGVPPGGSCRAAAAHACCCAHSGLAQCGCPGHAGTAAQLASLAACSGEAPSVLMALSPAVFVLPQAIVVPLQRCGAVPVAMPIALSSITPQPVTPPPQAA
jgi:hypothetical protein